MEENERVFPTHIIAAAGVVLNDRDEVLKDKVPERIKAPAILERYKAFLEYAGRPVYLEYRTRPAFELRLRRTV